MQTLKLRIDGMHCQGCAQTLQQALKRAPGVREARVSFEDRAVEVLMDGPQPRAADLVAVIKQAGFEAKPEGEPT